MITAVRRARIPAVAILLALLLAACGSAPGPSAPGTAGGAGFPVTVTHKFGDTVVPAAPQRVVSLGYTDQDAILALGVVPVAIREFTGGRPSATWPWASDRLQGQQPQVLPVGEVGIESLAALKPDLIIAVSAGLTQDKYDLYSRIAPVVAQPAQFVDYGTPWQDATKLIGTALGRSAEADRLVADLEARFAEAKAQHPELAGKTIAGVRPSSNDNASFFVWGEQDLRARFFAGLGMTVPPEFAALAGDQFYATVSTERLSMLDAADVVALITASDAERTAFTSLPGYSALRAVREGKVVTFDDEQSAALTFSSVLSLPSLLDTVPGQVSKVVATP